MDLADLAHCLPSGDQERVRTLVVQALGQGLEPLDVLNRGLIPGMDLVGRKFQAGEFYIPHLLLAARAMHAALDVLRPVLAETGARAAAAVVLGTVAGDLHDIGKNLVKIMLEGKGFEVRDIGIDAAPEKFVEAVDEEVKVVGLSALLSTTAPRLGDTLEALDKAGLLNRVKAMVGGGAVTQAYADKIGADGYGPDAVTAADLALKLAGLA
ncbi:MAG: corrinoid protein [Thermodesulfobacteriota bacterium]